MAKALGMMVDEPCKRVSGPTIYARQWRIDMEYSYAEDNYIEVRLNMERPESDIEYRIQTDLEMFGEKCWQSTPFQRADVSFKTDALVLVNAWLELPTRGRDG
jgi:hypothetical protein